MDTRKYGRKRVVVWTVIIIAIVITCSYFGTELYLKQKHPCAYRSYESLMTEYPQLRDPWKRKVAYVEAREAAEKALSANLETAIERGTMTERQAVKLQREMFEETLRNEAKFDEEFESECRRLTGA